MDSFKWTGQMDNPKWTNGMIRNPEPDIALSIWCCPFSCPFVSIKHKPWSSANIISLLRSLNITLRIPTLVPLALHIGLLLNLLLCGIGNVHIMNDD
jgi:hypothetical protein